MERPAEPSNETGAATNWPPAIANWFAFENGEPWLAAHEYPLFTDGWITGEISLGPYAFMNTVAVSNSRDVIKPAVILRYGVYKKSPYPDFRKTSSGLYHGGSPPEEVAALSSLIMGMRLRAGRTTRRFEPNLDPRGKPVEIGEQEVPYFQKPRTYKLPSAATGPHSLMDLTKLQTLAKTTVAEAIAIVRSARLYQDALWMAEPEPELAWVLLVSAVETAANEWQRASGENIARLKCSKPKLYKYLEGLEDSSVLSIVADNLVDSLGITKKFKDFLITFLPDPPSARPAEWAQFQWEEKELKRAFVTIYGYRFEGAPRGKALPNADVLARVSRAWMELTSGADDCKCYQPEFRRSATERCSYEPPPF